MALPLVDLSVEASFHVSTAVVQMRIIFQNTSKQKLDCLFSFPMKGTVTGEAIFSSLACSC